MMKIIVGEGSCGIAAGAGKVYDELQALLQPGEDITLGVTGCIGMCFLEPIVDIRNEKKELVRRLVHVRPEDAETIVDALRLSLIHIFRRRAGRHLERSHHLRRHRQRPHAVPSGLRRGAAARLRAV